MVLSSAGFWLLTSLLVGLLANRLPQSWLVPPRPQTGGQQLRRQDRMGVRQWKRWIPDGGAALPGGIAKASLVRRDHASLGRLLVETRRAELVHWILWSAAGVTALWLPPGGVLVNLLFATGFNLPCLVLQRYNRQRLQHCLRRAHGSR